MRTRSGQVVDDDGVLPDTIELPPDDSPPPPKRSRGEGAQASRESRRGIPRDQFQLNLDVLHLISESLHPLDLLNLARTCKSFRRLLMDKSSAFIWKAARRQVKGLPDCPADLSEPAYANLAFYPRCHACGKYTSAILWHLRRRYCPDCRPKRLCDLLPCPEALQNTILWISQFVLIGKERSCQIDRDQLNLLVQEYEHSSDKTRFLDDKRREYWVISDHARMCEDWRKQTASERKNELNVCRRERHRSILERIKQLGYEREINYFGRDRFRESRKKTPKPLTDEEWARLLPEWLKTMNRHRQLRLDAVIYRPRRRSLSSKYNIYVTRWTPDAPTFDLLPHLVDLVDFPPFRDIINAPEESQMDEKPFVSAFAQLPGLVDEWKGKLDTELAELVKIPPHLSSAGASCGLCMTSNCMTHEEVLQTDANKLRLACALFHVGSPGVFTHPEVFLASLSHMHDVDVSKRAGSIRIRFDIHFLDEAPYIVHACEMDPNVATVDDMDRRNARLRCLACRRSKTIILDWRDAMLHARSHHQKPLLAPLSESPRWQLVSDGYTDAIQAVEGSIDRKSLVLSYRRCLLCVPRVGDAMCYDGTIHHLWRSHEVKADDIKEGVHYVRLGVNDVYSSQVEMIEEGGQVIFREYHRTSTTVKRRVIDCTR